MNTGDMGPDDRAGFTAYFANRGWKGEVRVLVCGVLRTDYLRITDGNGRHGVFIPDMSKREIENTFIDVVTHVQP